jgi:hypothetical protein
LVNEFDAITDASSETASRGALQRGIIVEELRLAYVPVPKAACTSLRWLMADLIGLPAESFENPAKFRATQGQTIQNVHDWPSQYVVQRADSGWLAEVVEDDSWFRFSVVRDPARRLWSAWQSKLLLRQPEFVNKFGDEPWFPGVPSSPEEVIENYEPFVLALDNEDEEQRPYNSHWGLQTGVLGDALPALNHVGRVEAIGDTLGLLGEHVAQFGLELPPMRRENVTPLPYPDGLLSEETVRIIREYYAPDYRAFGYAEPEVGPPSGEAARRWKERTGILLDSVRVLISRNERLATLNDSMQEARRQTAKTRKDNERLRQEKAERDKQIVTLRRKIKIANQKRRKLRESLQEIQGSSTWRYTAPLRQLIARVKRAKGRLQGSGTSG